MERADTELVSAYLAGDTGAFEELYRRHAPAVWRFAWGMTGSEEAASEIVQDAFVRAALALGGWRGDSSLRTWLISVARSAGAEAWRRSRRQREEPLEDADPPAPGADPAEAASSLELAETVRRAVACLPDNERAAVILCEFQELAAREAAEAMGWTEGRMKMTLFRARRRLRNMLARYVGEAVEGGGR
ncbi:MAG: RNA polymerase sigma factor [Planctomycetota bacterium]|nr:RNA polymerase sigma factor [Planctomycetota bacterium]